MSHSEAQGRLLLDLARAAIAEALALPHAGHERPAWLDTPGAVFVTLSQGGQLRGCIGSLEAWRPLGEDLAANARAAALRDPRFPPLSPQELPGTRVEVSILSAPEPIAFASQADALAQLRPGLDGVILEWRGRRGTFLPQVWEQLPRAEDFLAHLKQKAGLPADFWADDVKLSRYTVEKFKEPA